MEQNIKYRMAGSVALKNRNYSYLLINVLLAVIAFVCSLGLFL